MYAFEHLSASPFVHDHRIPGGGPGKGGSMYLDPALTCLLCHTSDFEILRSSKLGFVVLCNECGYATRATVQHLIAS